MSAICSNPVKWKTQSVTWDSRIQRCQLRRSCFFSHQTHEAMYYIDLCVLCVCSECGACFFFCFFHTTDKADQHCAQTTNLHIKKTSKPVMLIFPLWKQSCKSCSSLYENQYISFLCHAALLIMSHTVKVPYLNVFTEC